MARKASNKKTKAEQQAELGAKHRAGEIKGPLPAEAFQGGNVVAEIVTIETKEEVLLLPPTPEGIELMKRAIEEGKTARFEGEAQPTEEEIDQVEEQEGTFDTEGVIEGVDEEEPAKPPSVVKDVFKKRYIEEANARGDNNKAAKRSNWDWLAQEIAKFCLDDKKKIDIRAFVALLNANGVDHSRWVSRTRGWEGRFRMTGRVALQKIVATQGYLIVPNGEEEEMVKVEAPQNWRDKYLPKA